MMDVRMIRPSGMPYTIPHNRILAEPYPLTAYQDLINLPEIQELRHLRNQLNQWFSGFTPMQAGNMLGHASSLPKEGFTETLGQSSSISSISFNPAGERDALSNRVHTNGGPVENRSEQKGALTRLISSPTSWRVISSMATAIAVGIALTNPITGIIVGVVIGTASQPWIACLEAKKEKRIYTPSDCLKDAVKGGLLGGATVGIGRLIATVAGRIAGKVHQKIENPIAKCISNVGGQFNNLIAWLVGGMGGTLSSPSQTTKSSPSGNA